MVVEEPRGCALVGRRCCRNRACSVLVAGRFVPQEEWAGERSGRSGGRRGQLGDVVADSYDQEDHYDCPREVLCRSEYGFAFFDAFPRLFQNNIRRIDEF